MTCDRSVIFSGYSGFLHGKKTDGHDITETLLKVTLNTINQKKRIKPFNAQFTINWYRCVKHTPFKPCWQYITFVSQLTLSKLSIKKKLSKITWLGLGLWCLTPLSTIFQLNRNKHTEKTIYSFSVKLVSFLEVPAVQICHKLSKTLIVWTNNFDKETLTKLSFQYYVIKLSVTCGRAVGFTGYSGFHHQ
jgi:hypothetical protein